MRKFAYLTIFGIVLGFFARASLSQAQGSAQSLANLENSYRLLLEEYRKEQDLFLISRQQYYTLKTLASQEETVQSMRTLLRTRADTLITYLTILELHLRIDPGIDHGRALPILTQLGAALDELKAHRARVEIAVDRIAADKEAAYLETREQPLIVLSDRAQTLLVLGRTQAAIDSMAATHQIIDGYIQTAAYDETKRTQKQRGSDELQRTLEAARSFIVTAWKPFDQAQLGNTSKIFSSIQGILSPSFGNLTQAVAFSKELIK